MLPNLSGLTTSFWLPRLYLDVRSLKKPQQLSPADVVGHWLVADGSPEAPLPLWRQLIDHGDGCFVMPDLNGAKSQIVVRQLEASHLFDFVCGHCVEYRAPHEPQHALDYFAGASVVLQLSRIESGSTRPEVKDRLWLVLVPPTDHRPPAASCRLEHDVQLRHHAFHPKSFCMRYLQELTGGSFPASAVLLGACLVIVSVVLPLPLRMYACVAGLVILLGAVVVALDSMRNDVSSKETHKKTKKTQNEKPSGSTVDTSFDELDRVFPPKAD